MSDLVAVWRTLPWWPEACAAVPTLVEDAVAYAKQWRRRVEDTRQHTGHVAPVPKTFAFG